MADGDMIAQHVRTLLGPDAVDDGGPDGVPVAAPRDEAGIALLLGTATQEGWRVRVSGSGRWMPPDAPADLTLTTRRLDHVTELSPRDLVVTVDGGTLWSDLRRALADEEVWVALDHVGPDRSVGSIAATGTGGPLRAGFGNLRDHVLGLTLVTGDGRVLRPGGRVVKNVAGFDLAKLGLGSFGAFGVLTSITLRLRTVPRADVTLVAHGPRDGLLARALEVLDHGITPAALELLSPAATERDAWSLAVRLVGRDAEVAATRDIVRGLTGSDTIDLDPHSAAMFWSNAMTRATQHPTTLRLGGLPEALDRALDLLIHHTADEWIAASVGTGIVRWSGTARLDDLRVLRHAAAQMEFPLTLERAPWSLRSRFGHFGAYREGVGRLVGSLRDTFDPAGTLVVPLDGDA
jgi:glycolate oxidase FAD binding subunit